MVMVRASTPTEINNFKAAYNSFFNHAAVLSRFEQINDCYSAERFVKYGLEQCTPYKNDPTELANVFYWNQTLMSAIISRKRYDCLELFITYAKDGKFNFNRHFDFNRRVASCGMTEGEIYFEGDLSWFNPLLYAVFCRSSTLVKILLRDKHEGNLLKLDKEITMRPYTSPMDVRSIARKITNKRDRETMLEALRADPEKHDITVFKKVLKGDLSITVREAVLNNSILKLEAALWLGNFGESKTDPYVIKYARKNGNTEMVEILELEGFVTA